MAFEQYLSNSIVYWGFWDFILPFLLIFAIVFAILQKVKLFGKEGKRYNVVVALVMGLVVVIPHNLGILPPYRDPVTIMQNALPQVSIVLVAIVMALLIIGLFGRKVHLAGNSLSLWMSFAAFAVIIIIFGGAANWWHMPWWLGFLMDPELQALVITILVFAIIIGFITHEPKKERDAGKKSIGEQLGEMLKKGDED